METIYRSHKLVLHHPIIKHNDNAIQETIWTVFGYIATRTILLFFIKLIWRNIQKSQKYPDEQLNRLGSPNHHMTSESEVLTFISLGRIIFEKFAKFSKYCAKHTIRKRIISPARRPANYFAM